MLKNKLLVLIVTSLIIIVSALFALLDVTRRKDGEIEMYYEIAKKKALELHFNLKDSQIQLDKGNVKWDMTLKDLKKSDPEYAKQFDILGGRDYKTVEIYPKSQYTLGGVLWVFIDVKTKEVITVCGEM
jgi:hypothetical protein